ncbi:MBL fold metallo-hydrolase [Pseudonocardia pini]|uniref:MBL fold metallo-hydrolase n=1 Tax=Pseudonocardia pini TaxID=2758030 RepID=UPI0015F043F4|nr:MBL fold metallo-hydrolase [Pseudonocardia pini]
MKLVVLGCSGSGPGPGSPASGYLVEAGPTMIALDLGNGTFGALQRAADPWSLAAVAFSHLHPDHCADFSALAVWRLYHPEPPAAVEPLPVLAPADAAERFAAAYAPSVAQRSTTELARVFDFRTHVPQTPLGDVVVRTAAVDHPCEAYALRVEHGGRSLVYSGDTGPCRGLVELAAGADVLLCEASWPHTDSMPTGVHLSGRQAGEHAAAAGVGRLLLTHVPAWTDADAMLAEAKTVFDGPVELVRPDGEYEV